jgi:hypothetical protein
MGFCFNDFITVLPSVHQIKLKAAVWANPIFFRGLTKVTPTFQGSETKNDPLEAQAYGRDCQFRIIPSLILSGS